MSHLRRIVLWTLTFLPVALVALGVRFVDYGLEGFVGNIYAALTCWTLGGLCIGVVLYSMRREARLVYGVVETLFGIGAIVGTIINVVTIFGTPRDNLLFSGQDRFTAIFLMGAAIYVFVRGLDNVGEGSRDFPGLQRFWDSLFPLSRR